MSVSLEIGCTVRYKGLGAGRVVDHTERRFRGRDQRFAVIVFPHREMRAQIPIGDPQVEEKLSKVLGKTRLQKLLRTMRDCGRILPRTWDHREDVGQKQLREGGPAEWMTLIGSYALAEHHGVSLNSSDHELVHQALELFASELSCATDTDYRDTLLDLEERYDKIAAPSGQVEEGVHFASEAILAEVSDPTPIAA